MRSPSASPSVSDASDSPSLADEAPEVLGDLEGAAGGTADSDVLRLLSREAKQSKKKPQRRPSRAEQAAKGKASSRPPSSSSSTSADSASPSSSASASSPCSMHANEAGAAGVHASSAPHATTVLQAFPRQMPSRRDRAVASVLSFVLFLVTETLVLLAAICGLRFGSRIERSRVFDELFATESTLLSFWGVILMIACLMDVMCSLFLLLRPGVQLAFVESMRHGSMGIMIVLLSFVAWTLSGALSKLDRMDAVPRSAVDALDTSSLDRSELVLAAIAAGVGSFVLLVRLTTGRLYLLYFVSFDDTPLALLARHVRLLAQLTPILLGVSLQPLAAWHMAWSTQNATWAAVPLGTTTASRRDELESASSVAAIVAGLSLALLLVSHEAILALFGGGSLLRLRTRRWTLFPRIRAAACGAALASAFCTGGSLYVLSIQAGNESTGRLLVASICICAALSLGYMVSSACLAAEPFVPVRWLDRHQRKLGLHADNALLNPHFETLFYSGGYARPNLRIANALAGFANTSYHSSGPGANFDLVLRLCARESSGMLLQRLVLRTSPKMPCPLKSLLVFLHDELDAVSLARYTSRYDDFTLERFRAMQRAGTPDEPVLMVERNQHLTEIECGRVRPAKFVHIKLIACSPRRTRRSRSTTTERPANIQLQSLVLLGKNVYEPEGVPSA